MDTQVNGTYTATRKGRGAFSTSEKKAAVAYAKEFGITRAARQYGATVAAVQYWVNGKKRNRRTTTRTTPATPTSTTPISNTDVEASMRRINFFMLELTAEVTRLQTIVGETF